MIYILEPIQKSRLVHLGNVKSQHALQNPFWCNQTNHRFVNPEFYWHYDRLMKQRSFYHPAEKLLSLFHDNSPSFINTQIQTICKG